RDVDGPRRIASRRHRRSEDRPGPGPDERGAVARRPEAVGRTRNSPQVTPFITIQQASATYPVFVGRGLLDSVGKLIQPRGRVFVITSSSLRHFGERVAQGGDIITSEAAEQHKTMATANAIGRQRLDLGANPHARAV